MKIALVHELLTMRGGAERVLKILANMFPDAPIYTLLYDEKKLGDWFPCNRVRISYLQPTFHFNHHLYLSRFPRAVEQWDFSGFDVVLSTSSAFVHGIITNSAPKHLSYINSPARYLWDRTHDVLNDASRGILGSLKRWHLQRTFHKLRIWDSEAADRPDTLLAASKIVQRRIELYWRRQSDVLSPPIDDFWLTKPQTSIEQRATSNYHLLVSSLVRYKRIDLAIEACNKTGKHLKIVGEGPDMARLKKLAGPTIEFCGWKSNNELADLYRGARATIFPGDEDFGLVPLESMACGTPVIAYGSGGALETILEGKTGEFFREPTSDSLLNSIKIFEQKNYSPETCIARAKNFSREKFERGILGTIDTLMKR